MKLVTWLLVCAACVGATQKAHAQDSVTTRTQPSSANASSAKPGLFELRDVGALGAVTAGAALIAPFDERVTHWMRRPVLQDKQALKGAADVVRVTADPGAIVISLSMFAVGRVTRKPGITDAGLHATESLIASGIVTQALKHVIGRARPFAVADSNAFVFHGGVGTDAGFTSMPSGHATAAFTAAAAFATELRLAHVRGARFLAPALYGLATLSALSRVYDDRHWLSDVVVGAGIGTIAGNRIVTYTHATPNSKLNALRMHTSFQLRDGNAPAIVFRGSFR